MCSNARPFLNMVQKSTAEARKLLEWISGFKIEDFVTQNPEYTHIENITKGHAIEDVLKQLRKNLTAAEEGWRKPLGHNLPMKRTVALSVRLKFRFGTCDCGLNHQIEELDKQEVILMRR